MTGPADPLGTTPTSVGSIGPSALGGPITQAQMIARADDWINQSVTYSTAQDSTGDADWIYWSDSTTGGPCRQDCSGFVSTAWGLTSSLATPTLPGVSTVTDSNISGDTNLNPGDALDYTADHVVLFDHWTYSSGDFAYDAEHTEGQATNRSTDNIYDSSLEGYAMSDFEALQYNNINNNTLVTGDEVAFQASSTGDLWAFDVGTGVGVSTGLGVMSGTSPSITALSNGDAEIAFQAANTSKLWKYDVSTGTGVNTTLGQMTDTNPSITTW